MGGVKYGFSKWIAVLCGATAWTAAADTSGIEFHSSLALSSYRYEEPGLMQLKGQKAAIELQWVNTAPSGQQLAIDVRGVFGPVDYSSQDSGSDTGEPDFYTDLRLLGGQSIRWGSERLTPYLGLGWRRLVNDSSGMTTSTGAVGYRRTSNYFYLPLGANLSFSIAGEARLEINAEFDHLVSGTQKSELPGETINNTQRRGRGWRFGFLYGNREWAIGPFIQAWKIAKSNEVDCDNGTAICFEPANETREFGIRVQIGIR